MDSERFGRIRERLQEIYARSPVKFVFYTITLLCLIILTAASLITNGVALESILFSDRTDYFMDYFNSIYYGLNGPYMNYYVIYPPLITVLYQAVGLLLESCYGLFTDGFSIRDTFGGMASYIIFTIIALVAIYFIFDREKKVSKKEMLLFFLVAITSYPMIYCIDRGNSMLYSVVFVALFLLLYNSPNKKDRYFSYIFLSIAVSIKIYPVLFGILIFKKSVENKEYREFIACAVICVLTFFLPFFLTDGTFIDMFRNATNLSSIGVTFGQVNIVAMFEQLLIAIGVENYADFRSLGTVLSMILLAVIAVFILFDKKMPEWQAVSLLAGTQVLCAGLGTQYLLLYMIIPAWYFINSNPNNSKINMVYGILFAIILLIIPGIGPDGNILSFTKGIITLILTIVILTDCYNRIRGRRNGCEKIPITEG